MKLFGGNHPGLVVYYDPGLCSLNIGDEIISDSAYKCMRNLISDCFPVRLSTHQPTSFRYRRHFSHAKMGFVLGSNLLKSNMLFGFRQWSISLIDTLQIDGLVLVGCGWQTYDSTNVDLYSRRLYRRLLSDKYAHSVRDEYTKSKLQSIGIENVINTGCPSLWSLDAHHCNSIRAQKGEIAVTTITDYNRNSVLDKEMLQTLINEYEKVYVWLQGSGDREYIEALGLREMVNTIGPSLEEYDAFLTEHKEADYVGTRLHAGIRALQHKIRTLIIAIDNRAIELGKDSNLPILSRNNIDNLSDKINLPLHTQIRVNRDRIDSFINQFL